MLIPFLAATLLTPTDNTSAAQACTHVRVNHSVRATTGVRRKVLIVSVGQSNNGLMNEPGDGPAAADFSDGRIRELSQGIVRQHYTIAPVGETHVFQHPAQDDSGGVCMRLAGAKALLRKYPAIEEVTLYCGAAPNTSLAVAADEWAADGQLTRDTIGWCSRFMADHPDYRVVFWSSLGATDAVLGMDVSVFQSQMALLAHTLRTSIPGAANACWIQGDMPSDLVDVVNHVQPGNGTLFLQAQNTVGNYIPNSVAVTVFDLTTYDSRHLTANSLRTFGVRVGLATSL